MADRVLFGQHRRERPAGGFLVRRRLLAALAAGMVLLAPHAMAQEADEITEKYSDWNVRCVTSQSEGEEEKSQRCWMVQVLTRKSGGERLVQVEIVYVHGAPRLVILAPFGLLLTDGVQFTIDDEESRRLDFRTCLPAGCIIESDLEAPQAAALRRGERLVLRFTVAASGQPIDLAISLAGVTAAMDRLKELAG